MARRSKRTKKRGPGNTPGHSPNPLGDEDDWAMLHYAVGILMGIGSKYGLVDVTIYHNSLHVRIERVKEKDRHDRHSS